MIQQLIIVCLSAALHGILAFVFADICYEFDLHIATYYLPTSPEYAGRKSTPQASHRHCHRRSLIARETTDIVVVAYIVQVSPQTLN